MQDRVTDHRLQLSVSGMEAMMAGRHLDRFIAVARDAQAEAQLAALAGSDGRGAAGG